MTKKVFAMMISVVMILSMTTACFARENRRPVYDAQGNLLYTVVTYSYTDEEQAVINYYESYANGPRGTTDQLRMDGFMIGFWYAALVNESNYFDPKTGNIIDGEYCRTHGKPGVLTGDEGGKAWIKYKDPTGYSILFPNG